MSRNIVIGVPSARDVSVHTLASLRALETPDGYGILECFFPSAVIWSARGSIVDQFLASPENHYLFFCDSDMVVPPHALNSMLSRDADIVAGLCCRRTPPYRPVIMTGFEEEKGGVIQAIGWLPMTGAHPIWGSGLACSLIKRHVLEAIRKEFGPHIFWHHPLKNGDVLGEDVTFYLKANRLGFRTILDADVHVGHLTEWPIYPADAKRWSEFDAASARALRDKDREIAALKEKLEAACAVPAQF